jgi:hypothetical protein
MELTADAITDAVQHPAVVAALDAIQDEIAEIIATLEPIPQEVTEISAALQPIR